MLENFKGLGWWFALHFFFLFYIFLELSFNFKMPKESPNLTGKWKILEHILVDPEIFQWNLWMLWKKTEVKGQLPEMCVLIWQLCELRDDQVFKNYFIWTDG